MRSSSCMLVSASSRLTDREEEQETKILQPERKKHFFDNEVLIVSQNIFVCSFHKLYSFIRFVYSFSINDYRIVTRLLFRT